MPLPQPPPHASAASCALRSDWGCDNCLHCPLIGEWDFNLCAQPLAQGRLAPELASIS